MYLFKYYYNNNEDTTSSKADRRQTYHKQKSSSSTTEWCALADRLYSMQHAYPTKLYMGEMPNVVWIPEWADICWNIVQGHTVHQLSLLNIL